MYFYVCILGSFTLQRWCFPECDLWNTTVCSLKIILFPFNQILKHQILVIWLNGITQNYILNEKFKQLISSVGLLNKLWQDCICLSKYKNGMILCAHDPPLSEEIAS